MVEPADRAIMHFTHVDNLRSIVSRGALLADNRTINERIDVVQCADRSIKMARRFKPVRVTPYGVVGDYVSFYQGEIRLANWADCC